MKILSKYLLREHVGPFFFSITALTSLLLLQYVGRQLGQLVGKGLPWTVIAQFFLLCVPFTVTMTVPMAVLIAVLYAFIRVGSENEITAMRASGVNMLALLVPTLAAGVGVSVAMLVFNDQIWSRANHELRVLQDDITKTKPNLLLKEQVINTVAPERFYLRAASIDHGSQEMKDVTIFDFDKRNQRRTIYAKSGSIHLAPNQTDLLLKLYDGEIQTVPPDRPEQLQRLFFAADQLRMQNVTNSFQLTNPDSSSKADREMTVCQMENALSDADFRWQEARYRFQVDTVRKRLGPGAPPPPTIPKPARRSLNALGRTYCSLLAHLGVRTATAATVQGSAAQRPAAAPVPAPSGAADRPTIERVTRFAQSGEEIMKRRFDLEIHKKFSLAAACFVFALLGAPIALRFPRGGVGLVIAVSFSVFALYYIGLIWGESLSNRGAVAPVWAMWAANVLLATIALIMIAGMNRVSGGNRGGDWSEVRAVLRRLFRHPST